MAFTYSKVESAIDAALKDNMACVIQSQEVDSRGNLQYQPMAIAPCHLSPESLRNLVWVNVTAALLSINDVTHPKHPNHKPGVQPLMRMINGCLWKSDGQKQIPEETVQRWSSRKTFNRGNLSEAIVFACNRSLREQKTAWIHSTTCGYFVTGNESDVHQSSIYKVDGLTVEKFDRVFGG